MESVRDEHVEIDRSGALREAVRSLGIHLNSGQKRNMAILLGLIFMSALVDVFGIASILPLVKLAESPAIIHSYPYLDSIYNYLGFENDRSFLLFSILSVLVFFILKSAFGLFVTYVQTRFSSNAAFDITKKQFNKYFNLSYHDFSGYKSSVITHHIINNPVSYATWVLMPLIQIASELMIVLLIVTGIAVYDFKLFLLIAAIIGPSTWGVYALLRGRTTRIGSQLDKLYPKSLITLQQTINGYIDVKLANKEQYYRDVFLRFQRQYHKMNMSLYLQNQVPMRANELVAVMGIILIFLYAIFLTDNQGNAVLMVSLFAAAAYRLMPSINRITSSLVYIQTNLMAIRNLSTHRELVHDPGREKNQEKIVFNNDIHLRDLTFRFTASNHDTLKGIDIKVNKGEKIGIIGSSGSGKTTLMNIVLRFYRETGGGVYIDNTKLTVSHTRAWRNMIGYVKQDIFLLDGSIRDNIVFGDENPDEQRLSMAVKMASLQGLINSLPDGLDTMIGEKGSRLSGGQRQRISIARSLYRNAQILIFDEATSALDNQTEQEVSEAIDSLSDIHKTVFIIAHRITTLRNCDRIYELEDGRVKGVYKYPELLEKVL
jgi:ABC-type multidrug transport system fused ATPase/permease subunit